MGLRDDLHRFRKVGEENRMDLQEFIKKGQMEAKGGKIQIPIKIISLPEFRYAQLQEGGIGQGEGAEEGDIVDVPEDGDGDGESDEAGEGEGEHGFYDMDPEEFAEELDDELGLDLEPKGKKVIEEVQGDFTDIARNGPRGSLDVKHLYKQGLKRTMAMDFNEDLLREVMKVDGWDVDDVFTWARENSIAVSRQWIDREYDDIEERDRYESIDEMFEASDIEFNPGQSQQARRHFDDVDIRMQDERYRHQEVEQKRQKNAVVVNIRDVSGSMMDRERELVERVFAPLDWYLQGKYDHAEFIYIAHDTQAWEVEREDFFGITSGGGTRVSSAYELAEELLEEQYPYSEWNRFVFGAGDGDNMFDDTVDNVVPLVQQIDANKHGYIEVASRRPSNIISEFEANFNDDDSVRTAMVNSEDGAIEAIRTILHNGDD